MSAANEPKVCERDLGQWRLIERFGEILEQSFSDEVLHPSFSDVRRRLTVRSYLSLYLLGLFNPVVKTMRGLCQASRLQRVQAEVCGRAVSLGSFSEAQHLLDPELLRSAFGELAAKLPGPAQAGCLGQWRWLAQDSSLFAALPRMAWALYGGGRTGAANRAVRLHLGLEIVADKPVVVAVTPGKTNERQVWRQQWQSGHAYVGDRGYGQEYRIFGELETKGCAYVLRLREQQCVMNVLVELPVSPDDRAAGVIRQAWAELGCKERYRSVPVRVVWIQTPEPAPLLLVTNLNVEALPAELVSQLYRQRWKIELFFRWIKCILGCRHWLAESPAGAAIQIYLALIAALLLQLYTGRKPNRRMLELLQWHQMGMASERELVAGLKEQLQRPTTHKKR